jgi:hypothetical protein
MRRRSEAPLRTISIPPKLNQVEVLIGKRLKLRLALKSIVPEILGDA